MFEFHGWATLRMTYLAEEDADEGNIGAMLLGLKQKVFSTSVATHFHFHDNLNGMESLSVSGLRNHRKEEVIGIFAWIAENAPGSYGLLYVLDNEDQREVGYDINFRVFRLARGLLQELADPFLSPPIPVVEDVCEA